MMAMVRSAFCVCLSGDDDLDCHFGVSGFNLGFWCSKSRSKYDGGLSGVSDGRPPRGSPFGRGRAVDGFLTKAVFRKSPGKSLPISK